MITDWFVYVGELQQGPIDDLQLNELVRSGFLKPSDLVCRPGMDWIAAGSLPVLFPPAVNSVVIPTRQIPSTAPGANVPCSPPLPFNSKSVNAPRGGTDAALKTPVDDGSTKSHQIRRRTSSVSFISTVAAIILGAAAAVYVALHVTPLIKSIAGRDHVEGVSESAPPPATLPTISRSSPDKVLADIIPAVASASRPIAIGPTAAASNVIKPPLTHDGLAVIRVHVTERTPAIYSGFAIGDDDKWIGLVTCLSAIRNDRPVSVFFSDGRTLPVEGFLAVLPEHDLILLKVAEGPRRVLRLADPKSEAEGDVFVAGSKSIAGFGTVSTRISPTTSVDASRCALTTEQQSTFRGAPVLNAAGEVLGVVVDPSLDSSAVVVRQPLAALVSAAAEVRPLTELPSLNRSRLPLLVSSEPEANPPNQNGSPSARPVVAAAVNGLRRAVPDNAAEQKARQLFIEVYGDDLGNAARPDQKRALIEKLLDEAKDNGDDPGSLYVLLKESQKLAIELGDVMLIERTTDGLSAAFQIDPVDALAKAWESALELPLAPAAKFKSLSEVALARLTGLELSQRYDTAERIYNIALAAALKSHDSALLNAVEVRGKLLSVDKKLWDESQQAVAVLQVMPDDPMANLTLGRYLCFVQGKWSDGFMHLAKGSDPELARLAKLSVADSRESEKQIELGDLWWQAAETKNEDPVRLADFQAGSRYWYSQAISALNGLLKKRIDQRINVLNASLGVGTSRAKSAGLPASLAGRFMKPSLLATHGGTKETEEAVQAALAWLAEHQLPNGLWSLTGKVKSNQGTYTKGSAYENEEAATAMALLAFAGAGETHKSGAYVGVIGKALTSLLQKQDARGNFFHGERIDDALYTQAQCTIAVCELFALTKDETLKVSCDRAVQYCLSAQDPSLGGWRYRPRSDSDTSVTGWMISALQSARNAGLDVPQANLDLVSRYLDKASMGVGAGGLGRPGIGSKYAYQPGLDYDRVMTAEGLLCRMYLGWTREDPRLVAGCDLLLDHLPKWRDRDVYFWYYTSQTMFHMEGRYWKTWNESLRDMLVSKQEESGPERGSWDPLDNDGPDLWSLNKHGGRLYVTCFSTYMLESYYRYLPLFSDLKKQMEDGTHQSSVNTVAPQAIPISNGVFAGLWKSDSGLALRLTDDSATVSVTLASTSEVFKTLEGALNRTGEKWQENDVLKGTLTAVFADDPLNAVGNANKRTLTVSRVFFKDSATLRLITEKVFWNDDGKETMRRPETVDFARD